MNPVKRIFIIGHPGAGKGLLAKTIANHLGWQFVDADFGIEFHLGKTMNEIFGTQGEESFFNCISHLLTEQLKEEHVVITTDASIVCNEKIRKLLSNEFVVYLEVSTSVQIERTLRHPAPLLLANDIKMFMDKLHQARDILYTEVAKVTINGNDSALEEHVLSIIKIVSENKSIESISNQLRLDEKDMVLFHKKRHGPIRLSEQQALCLKLLAQGKSSKDIARDLNISYRTVEGHIAKIMELLGCTSSKELISLYHDRP